MAADEAGEKTEQPTPRRRQEAREHGQVPRSTDLTAAVVLLAALGLLNAFGPGLLERALLLTRELGESGEVRGDDLGPPILHAASSAAFMLVPILLLLATAAAVGSLLQSGPVLAWKRAQPKLENASPGKGVKRIFSTDSLTRGLMGLLKLALVAAVAYVTIRGDSAALIGTGTLEAGGVFSMAAELTFKLALRLALVLLVLGAIDYSYQRWKLEKNLRMTKQEVRDELKRMEGDPVIKQRRRQAQLRLAMQRLQIDVPKADVVVTNPTEYAVALRYDEQTMTAPRVIAKGKGWLAERIRQLALLSAVPIVQRPPLARTLYATVDVGEEIPPQLYRAVAEVLAYVYQLTRRAAG
ncbi:MAG: flagellar biosynthesis protein FlhB [Phycisphaerae bacterium]|jgi:flagellar biosynthetic protein FlhB